MDEIKKIKVDTKLKELGVTTAPPELKVPDSIDLIEKAMLIADFELSRYLNKVKNRTGLQPEETRQYKNYVEAIGIIAKEEREYKKELAEMTPEQLEAEKNKSKKTES